MLGEDSNRFGLPVGVPSGDTGTFHSSSLYRQYACSICRRGMDPDPGQNRGSIQRLLCEQYLSVSFYLYFQKCPMLPANSRELQGFCGILLDCLWAFHTTSLELDFLILSNSLSFAWILLQLSRFIPASSFATSSCPCEFVSL